MVSTRNHQKKGKRPPHGISLRLFLTTNLTNENFCPSYLEIESQQSLAEDSDTEMLSDSEDNSEVSDSEDNSEDTLGNK